MSLKTRFTSNEFVQSFCNDDYMVIPLSVLLSMPVKWRRQLIETLLKVPRIVKMEDFKIGPYTVGLRSDKGKFVFDYLAKSDYLLPRKKRGSWLKRLFN